MITIGKLAKAHGLSRSTLLYYDRIGLLCPSGHVKGEYRFYTEEDQERLKRICTYRKAGVSIKNIQGIIASTTGEIHDVLESRLEELNEYIQICNEQQNFICELLGKSNQNHLLRKLNKDSWVKLLTEAGFSDEDKKNWHKKFEKDAPDKHQKFLEKLQIPDEEISKIRTLSRR